MKTQEALLDSSNKLQFTDKYDITYCVETTNDTAEKFNIEFSAWRDCTCFQREHFSSIKEFENFCKAESINIDDFRLYDPETDEYID